MRLSDVPVGRWVKLGCGCCEGLVTGQGLSSAFRLQDLNGAAWMCTAINISDMLVYRAGSEEVDEDDVSMPPDSPSAALH